MTDFLDSVDERYRHATEALRGLLRADAQYAHRIYTFRPENEGDSDHIWSVMAVELYGRICALLNEPPYFLPDEAGWATIVAYAVGQDSIERLQKGTMPGVPNLSTLAPSDPMTEMHYTGPMVVKVDGQTRSLAAGETIVIRGGEIVLSER